MLSPGVQCEQEKCLDPRCSRPDPSTAQLRGACKATRPMKHLLLKANRKSQAHVVPGQTTEAVQSMYNINMCP